MPDDVWVKRGDGAEFSINLSAWVRYPLNIKEDDNGTMVSVFHEAAIFHEPQSDRFIFEFEPAHVPPGAEVDYGFGKIKLRHRRDYRPEVRPLGSYQVPPRPWGLNYVELKRVDALRLARKGGVTIPRRSSPLSPPKPGPEASFSTPESQVVEGRDSHRTYVLLAPVSPLLNDPDWREGFKQALQLFVDVARRLSLSHRLPGYPLWIAGQQLKLAYVSLCGHLLRVREHNQELGDRHGAFAWGPIEPDFFNAYQWTCGLVEESRLNISLSESGESPPFDLSMIPTQTQLDSFQAILDLLNRSENPPPILRESPTDARKPEEPEEVRPRWDSAKLTLYYGGIRCRFYERRNAPNQFKLLAAFQEAGWPRSIDSPFDLDRTLRETTDSLNEGLDQPPPIRFAVEARKPIWYKAADSASSG
jgi:hypothetical protein